VSGFGPFEPQAQCPYFDFCQFFEAPKTRISECIFSLRSPQKWKIPTQSALFLRHRSGDLATKFFLCRIYPTVPPPTSTWSFLTQPHICSAYALLHSLFVVRAQNREKRPKVPKIGPNWQGWVGGAGSIQRLGGRGVYALLNPTCAGGGQPQSHLGRAQQKQAHPRLCRHGGPLPASCRSMSSPLVPQADEEAEQEALYQASSPPR
jgi:hypothetical protein